MLNIFSRSTGGAFGLLLFSIAMTGCGGSSGSNTTPAPGPSVAAPPVAVLVPNAQYQYSGTENVAITYTTPSATAVNSNGSYAYTSLETVTNAAAGAPAPFDVNRATTYTAVTPPVSGSLLLTTNNDNYETQTFSGSTETLTLAATAASSTSTDLNAGLRLGNGPFNVSSQSTTTFSTPQTLDVYPLQTGATITEPIARSVSTTTTDANGAGTYGGGGVTTATFNNDGSYTRNFQATDGSSQSATTVSGNGSATQNTTFATGSTRSTTIAVPASGVIPVSITTNGTTQSYSAADWYPGGAVPAPLASTVRTIVGAATLPSACAFGGTPPPVIEVDVTNSSFDPFGVTTQSTTRSFLLNGTVSNGVEICRLVNQTTNDYTLTTGLPSAVTTTTSAETLVASTQTIAGVRRLTETLHSIKR